MPEKEYDFALSYAGEDREYVEAVATALVKLNRTVFYDRFEEADLIGRNLIDHLSEVYQHRAKLCVVFVSAAYARKPYARVERQSAQARAFLSETPYIIPVRLDDTKIPGLLDTIAYVSGKTPEALALLLAAKLLLNEPEGVRLPGAQNKAKAVIVRFDGLLEPDMETFRKTLAAFDHWSPTKLGSIPVELRMPEPYLKEIEAAKAFRQTAGWNADEISDDARTYFSTSYDEWVPRFYEDTIKGVARLIAVYRAFGQERLEAVVRLYLMCRNTILARMLLGTRLVGMAPVAWEDMFAHFAHSWSRRIMDGLAYVSYLEGDERFLWVDVDGYDTSRGVKWPQGRFRLYAPSWVLVNRRSDTKITKEQFDRFFALQFLELEKADNRGLPLAYFAEYPERLQLIIRGELAIETQHFDSHSTSNDQGRPLYEAVRKLRDYMMKEILPEDSPADPPGFKKARVEPKIRRLFRSSDQFDEILGGELG